MVEIIIPIYKEKPSFDDLISIHQGIKIFSAYNITIIHPKNLKLDFYKKYSEVNFKAFPDEYFQNILGYNKLMLNVNFYKSFSKKYILIYQTDAYVFKDELEYWCEKDYDYIGAPWVRSREKLPIIKYLWDNILYNIKKYINYKGNQKTQKNKSLLYNEVGNGGFSLRKREKCIEVLEKLKNQVNIYINPKNQSRFYAEDVFFSIEPLRNGLEFKKPNYKEAIAFAIENKPDFVMHMNNNKLPFGCHRWNKENRDFWSNFIKL